jgi:hypothetical protein
LGRFFHQLCEIWGRFDITSSFYLFLSCINCCLAGLGEAFLVFVTTVRNVCIDGAEAMTHEILFSSIYSISSPWCRDRKI